MNALRDAALEYAARGWPVFPLGIRGKVPLKETHGLLDATTDEARICLWWTQNPNYNIGLATGVKFDVIDIDGPEPLLALVQYQAGREMTTGPEVQTARGQHLFHLPTGLGNRAGILPGVDFRGKGGYVIAPPSVHPSGHVYKWAVYRGEDGVVDGVDEPLTEVPLWLLDLINPPKLAPEPPRRPAASSGYGLAALEREVGRVAIAAVGERNHTLNKAAFSLGQLVGAGALTAEEVASSLVVVAVRIGLREDEARATTASGLRAGLRLPRMLPS